MQHARQLPDPECLQDIRNRLLNQRVDFQGEQGPKWLEDLVPGTEAEPTGAAATDLIQKLQRQNREQLQQLEEAKKQLEAKNQKIEVMAKGAMPKELQKTRQLRKRKEPQAQPRPKLQQKTKNKHNYTNHKRTQTHGSECGMMKMYHQCPT